MGDDALAASQVQLALSNHTPRAQTVLRPINLEAVCIICS